MRPTNVRASVGSSASGSSASAIVSVPPFLSVGVAFVRADALTPTASASRSTAPSDERARE